MIEIILILFVVLVSTALLETEPKKQKFANFLDSSDFMISLIRVDPVPELVTMKVLKNRYGTSGDFFIDYDFPFNTYQGICPDVAGFDMTEDDFK